MSKRSKACDITAKVRKEIHERDKHCIMCGSHYGLQIAHVFYNRSHGGLAVKENLALLCVKCHKQLDEGKLNEQIYMRESVENYLRSKYDIKLEDLKYSKEQK